MISRVDRHQWLLFLPLAYLLGPALGFGLLSVWLLQSGSRSLQSFLFVRMWRAGNWEHIKV